MRTALLGVLAAAVSASAWAHVGVHPPGGFGPGVVHPFFGLDHLLVMLAASAWVVRIAGPSRAKLPATVVATLAVGALIVVSL